MDLLSGLNAGTKAIGALTDIYGAYKSADLAEKNLALQRQAYNDSLRQKQRENDMIDQQNMLARIYGAGNAGNQARQDRGNIVDFYQQRGY